jgi:hypothetical protein
MIRYCSFRLLFTASRTNSILAAVGWWSFCAFSRLMSGSALCVLSAGSRDIRLCKAALLGCPTTPTEIANRLQIYALP